MPYRLAGRETLAVSVLFLIAFWATTASAQLYINEIYLDPAGETLDLIAEYIELRGDPNTPLANHYLVFLENETSATANPGVVDVFFDLGSLSTPKIGSNGYLRLRQRPPAPPFQLYGPAAPGTTDLFETGVGFGNGWANTGSTVGFRAEGENNKIENSGFTAMLIRNNGGAATQPYVVGDPNDPNTPALDLDWDDDNELDSDPNQLQSGAPYLTNWTILDSVGINSEATDIDGFLYAPINFGPGTPLDPNSNPSPNVPAGAEFVDAGYEIEYVARWGDSTGSSKSDWHVSNISNDPATGFNGPADYRQSGEPHGVGTPNQFVETSQGVPYGTMLVNSPGAPNVFILDGDYDPTYNGEEYVFNGVVNGLDFLAWQRNYGFGDGQYATRQHGDGDLSRTVDRGDLVVWAANYGSTLPGPFTAPLVGVPEPSTIALLSLVALPLLCSRRVG